ncbi:24106_t:CDS:1, partial [Dentiscutata erythropus]
GLGQDRHLSQQRAVQVRKTAKLSCESYKNCESSGLKLRTLQLSNRLITNKPGRLV